MKIIPLIVFIISIEMLPQWYQVSNGLANSLTDVFFIDDNTGFSVGWAGNSPAILKTSNGGENWIVIPSGIVGGITLNSIDFIDEINGITVGDDGCILKTSNGGDNWTNHSIFLYRLFGISFVDSSTAVAVGGGGTSNPYGYIYKSTNGGINWNNILTSSGSPLMDIDFINDTLGIAVGWDRYYLTTDKGTNWTASSINADYYGVDFINENTIYMVGSEGSIKKTINMGQSWINQNSGVNELLLGVNFTDINNGTVVSLLGSILRTTDGGENWTKQLNGTGQQVLSSVYFVNNDTGYAVGGGRIFKTVNGSIVPVELTSFTAAYSNKNINLIWSTATELNNHGFEIERSTNNIDWRIIAFKEGKGTTTEPHHYSFSDNISEITSSKLYYRLKQIDYNGSFEYSKVVEVEITPTKFSLEQNYPNPFNPSTKIKYTIPNVTLSGVEVSRVQLKVYDILGNEVAMLVNEEKPAGNFEVEFDASNLSSGVYYYQLRARSFVETKKMILLR